MWLLVISGPRRGEVWIDAIGADGRARRVAPSFMAWFREWIDALVRDDVQFLHWDGRCCATPGVISQVLDSLEQEGKSPDDACAELPNTLGSGAIAVASGGSPYFDQGTIMDPCQSCTALIGSFGMSFDVFRPGVPPRQARNAPGLLGRLLGR